MTDYQDENYYGIFLKFCLFLRICYGDVHEFIEDWQRATILYHFNYMYCILVWFTCMSQVLCFVDFLSRLVRCQLLMMTKVIMPDLTTHYPMVSPHSESTLLLVKSMSGLLSTGRQLQDSSSLYMCLMLVSKLIFDWLVWLLQLLSDWIVWLLHLPSCNWCLISYISENLSWVIS